MRALQAAVVVMGVLIVVGVAGVIVVIVGRLSGPGRDVSVQSVLDEPVGTRIAGVSTTTDRLAVQLQGGGPDRVVVVDIRTGRVVARTGLAR